MDKSPAILVGVVVFLLLLVGGCFIAVMQASASAATKGSLKLSAQQNRRVDLKNIHFPVTDPSTESPFVLLAHSSNRLGLDIFKTLPKDRNMLFSPLSLSSSLGLMYLGAGGQTENETKIALGLNSLRLPKERWFHETFEQYRRDLANLSRLENRQFLNIGKKVSVLIPSDRNDSAISVYKDEARRYYDADVIQISLPNKCEYTEKIKMARKQVLSFLDDSGFIVDSGSPSNFQESPIMFTSIDFMKFNWAMKFDPRHVIYRTFFQRGKEEQPVLMMHATMDSVGYIYSQELDSQLLELPYSGNRLSMVFILPTLRNGLEKLENMFTYEKVQNTIQRLKTLSVVDVRIPRFTLETTFNFTSALEAKGIKSAFNPQSSNFSHIIFDGHRLWVSDILHKAVLTVHEQGTDASFGSDQAEKFVSAPVTSVPTQFHATHPFLVAVRDRTNGMILFMGRIYEISEAISLSHAR